jgi:hypothetical protein
MAWLVFAEIDSRRFLLGAFGLNGSTYSIRDRDAFLGWSNRTLSLKRDGLLCVMDLAVCIALEPWCRVRGGKLVASLALSQPVADAYHERYRSRLPLNGGLLALITLCATGMHCPIFNRIMLKSGGLYRRVGMTAGYSTSFVSDETVTRARDLLRRIHRHPRMELFAKSMRLIQSALYACGLPGDCLLRVGVRKGIYVGTADADAIAMLRSGSYGPIRRPSVRETTAYWLSVLKRNSLKANAT